MKKIVSFCIVIALTGFGLSCKKTIDKLTEFDISYSNNLTVPAVVYTGTVTADTITAPAQFDSPQIPTEQAKKFDAEKTAKSLITEIKLKKFSLSVSTGNLDALKSISIYLKSAELGDVLIATKTSIPAGSTSITTDVADVNIKEYIFKDNMQFKIVTRMGIAASPEKILKMDQTLHVKASLIK